MDQVTKLDENGKVRCGACGLLFDVVDEWLAHDCTPIGVVQAAQAAAEKRDTTREELIGA